MLITSRPRRNRKSENIRNLISEYFVSCNDLIMPLFVIDGENKKVAIDSMPGQHRYSIDKLCQKATELYSMGIHTVALFPVIPESLKTKDAKEAYNPNGLNQLALKELKKSCPDLTIMTDVALDPYSSDGHDGIVDSKTGEILNDATVEILQLMSLEQAKAGSDILGPSDMMDGRVGAIRSALDKANFENKSIMAYTAKYASSFYGPFRDALDSEPKNGDKKSYQMDFRSSSDALRELELDTMEGADIVMVKPGLPYLDIIQIFKQHSNLPVAAYNVSGEYAMIKAAAQNGWLDGEMAMVESLHSFKRAGADIILTYFAEEMAMLLQKS